MVCVKKVQMTKISEPSRNILNAWEPINSLDRIFFKEWNGEMRLMLKKYQKELSNLKMKKIYRLYHLISFVIKLRHKLGTSCVIFSKINEFHLLSYNELLEHCFQVTNYWTEFYITCVAIFLRKLLKKPNYLETDPILRWNS